MVSNEIYGKIKTFYFSAMALILPQLKDSVNCMSVFLSIFSVSSAYLPLLSIFLFCLSFLFFLFVILFITSVCLSVKRKKCIFSKIKNIFCFTLLNRAWSWRMSNFVFYINSNNEENNEFLKRHALHWALMLWKKWIMNILFLMNINLTIYKLNIHRISYQIAPD